MVDLKNEKTQLNALESLFNQKRFSDALAIAKKLSHDFPGSFQIKFQYVRILKELNRLEEAEEGLKDLTMLFPNNLKLLLEMGNVAVKQNKFDEALEYFNKILFLDPFNDEAKNSIDKISAIKQKGLGTGEKEVDFITYQRETLDNADTLPEFDNKAILMQRKMKPPDPDTSSEPPLNLEPEDKVVPPPIPEVEVKETEVKESLKPPPIPGIKETDMTELLKPPPIPEGVEVETDRPADQGEGTEFLTESAALLYLKQELFDDALEIYSKLYASRKEEKFLLKIKEIKEIKEMITLKKERINRKKIEVLTGFLRFIQKRYQGYPDKEGDQIV